MKLVCMKFRSSSGFIRGFNFIITLTIVSVLLGTGLVLSHANADKDKLDIGSSISSQAGIGLGGGKSEVAQNASANSSITTQGAQNMSANSSITAQVNANATVSGEDHSNNHGMESQGEYQGTETSSEESYGHFKSSYEKMHADSDNNITIQSDRHLYKPGDQVEIDGTVWSGLTASVGSITAVSVQASDSDGNVVYNGTSNVDVSGQYSATFQLPSDAKQGRYTVDVKTNVSANVLSTLSEKIQDSLSERTKFIVVSPNAFAVKAEGQDFNVNIATNSTNVNNFNFDEQNKKISFTVQGDTGTKGVLDIDIPKSLLNGNLTATMDGQVMSQNDVIETDDQDHTTLELNYHHSTHQIDIIGTNAVPEFPVSTIAMTVAILGSVSVLFVFGNRFKF